MTQEERNLLLKDLCARLPYKVKAYIKNWSKLDQKYYEGTYIIESIHPSLNDIYAVTKNGSVEVILGHTDYVIKPYLFPLSSMTLDQRIEYSRTLVIFDESHCSQTSETYDWCNKNNFDYRDLIPKGLAIDCTNLNIY